MLRRPMWDEVKSGKLLERTERHFHNGLWGSARSARSAAALFSRKDRSCCSLVGLGVDVCVLNVTYNGF